MSIEQIACPVLAEHFVEVIATRINRQCNNPADPINQIGELPKVGLRVIGAGERIEGVYCSLYNNGNCDAKSQDSCIYKSGDN